MGHTTYRRPNRLQSLRDLGFDLSYHVPFTKMYHVRCSQCETLSINGVACHETGCPNTTHTCKGCDARVPRPNTYCEDCR